MDQTILLVLTSVLFVLVGLGDLLKRGARDLLGPLAVLGGGMVVGVGLEMLFPVGYLFGAAAGFSLGVPWLLRVEQRRQEAAAALLEAPDTASALLSIHDRLDAIEACRPRGKLASVGMALVVGFSALAGVGLVAIGLEADAWPFFLMASGFLLLPAMRMGAAMVEMDEEDALNRSLQQLRSGETPLQIGGAPAGGAADPTR